MADSIHYTETQKKVGCEVHVFILLFNVWLTVKKVDCFYIAGYWNNTRTKMDDSNRRQQEVKYLRSELNLCALQGGFTEGKSTIILQLSC